MGWFGGGSSAAPPPKSGGVQFDDSNAYHEMHAGAAGMGAGSSETAAVMQTLQSQMADAYAQEFFQTVRDKCFEKCVTRPSTSLSGGESKCLTNCCDRYREALAIVSQAVVTSLEGKH
ncbi:mitochondrial import inner membrane translocase subunit TIM13 [Pycnococcus provasolii]|mmetsp:Transcript_6506/g.14774  ORF Transcript_6506/g.14774 Transcript_6506/m.14774 type:complete len:118 (-) Transcript_6506:72-425(-)